MKVEGDGTLRVGFQNIRGADMNKGLGVAPKLDATNGLQVDIQGMAEANKSWNSRNKAMYQTQLDLIYNQPTAIFASAPADHECTYQPGGTMCIAASSSACRVLKSDSDRTGRLCWQTFQRKQHIGYARTLIQERSHQTATSG